MNFIYHYEADKSINKNKWIQIFMKLIYFKNIDNPFPNATKVTIESFSSILINPKNNHIPFNPTFLMISQKLLHLQSLTWQNTVFHKQKTNIQMFPAVSLFEAIMPNLVSSKSVQRQKWTKENLWKPNFSNMPL